MTKRFSTFNYLPAIVHYFRSVDPTALYFGQHGLNHPGAIYNLMTTKLCATTMDLCNHVQKGDVENVERIHRTLLHDFFQFYDACYEIMMCFCDNSTPKSNKQFTHDWLKKNGYPIGDAFHNATKDEVGHTRDVFNKLKHSSNLLQFIRLNNPEAFSFGYYIQRPPTGILLDPTSLYKELRDIYYLIYFISDALLAILKTTGIGTITPDPKAAALDEGQKFRELHELMKDLPTFFFLSETTKQFYQVEPTTTPTDVFFSRRIIGDEIYDNHYRNGVGIQVIFTTDGYNNSISIPYCGITPTENGRFVYLTTDGRVLPLRILHNQ